MIERDRDADNNSSNGLEERLYVQEAANWSVTAVLNTSGSVQERYVEDPYGSVTVLSSNWSTLSGSSFGWIYLHHGGRFDSTSGLYGFRNRDYSSAVGRWIEPDPSGFAAGDVNLYRYGENNPTVYTDPSGLLGVFFGGAGQTEDDQTKTIAYLKTKYDQKANGLAYFGPMRSAIKGAPGFNYRPFINLWVTWITSVVGLRPPGCGPQKENVDIFGYSRGAVFGVMLAAALKDESKIKLRFIGLLDPVSTSIQDVPNPLTVPDDVPTWIGVKNITGVSDLIPGGAALRYLQRVWK
jgi:RHS repeat-associated protein